MKNEFTLLTQARALEQDALIEIHELFYRPVFRYILLRVGHQVIAEDLTSEVFERFLVALREPSAPQNSIRGWIFDVASKVVMGYYRQHGRVNEIYLKTALIVNEVGPEAKVMGRMSAESLYRAIQSLSEEQQRVIALRYGAECRVREVADIMGKSEGAVKQLQLRALAALGHPGVQEVEI